MLGLGLGLMLGLGLGLANPNPNSCGPKVPARCPAPHTMYWPALLLDYRCHVPRGRLGTAFPPPTRRCLRRLADAPRAALVRRYGAAGDGGEGARPLTLNPQP